MRPEFEGVRFPENSGDFPCEAAPPGVLKSDTRDVSLFFLPYAFLWIQSFGFVEP